MAEKIKPDRIVVEIPFDATKPVTSKVVTSVRNDGGTGELANPQNAEFSVPTIASRINDALRTNLWNDARTEWQKTHGSIAEE